MKTAEIIREARIAADLSQSSLARLTGIRQPSISAFESGRVTPRPETLARILDGCRPRPSLILRRHRDEVLAAAAARKAGNVRVFGSVARGEDVPGSDVDVLVTFEEDASIIDAAGLKLDLEAILGVRVDLLSERSTGAVRDRAVSEAVTL